MVESSKLGSGTFGTVIREGSYAYKYTRDPFDAIKEYIWCSTLRHPNIIRHYDLDVKNVRRSQLKPELKEWYEKSDPSPVITDTSNTIGIIKMDACDSNLKSIILKETLTSDQYDTIINSIMQAIYYLHANLIIHSDLKPDNVLINYSKNPRGGITIKNVVVCDLGISNIQKYAEVHNTAPMYQCVDYKPTIEHDIYSLGVLIVRMFNPNLRAKKTKEEETPSLLLEKGKRRAIREFREPRYRRFLQAGYVNVPDRYRELVVRMTNPRGADRPSIGQCMEELGYDIPKVKPIYKKIYLFNYYNLQIDRDFYNIGTKTGLLRARMCSYALREFLHRKNLLKSKLTREEDKRVSTYMTAATIITQALYGSKRATFPDITQWYDEVDELVNDTRFVINLTTPSPYVREYDPRMESKSRSGSKSSSKSNSKRK